MTLVAVISVSAGAAGVEAAAVAVAAVVVVAGCKKFNTFVKAVNNRSRRGVGEGGTGSVTGVVVLEVLAGAAPVESLELLAVVPDAAGVLPVLAGVVPPKDWANFSSRCTRPL